jgi:hypothetical protein
MPQNVKTGRSAKKLITVSMASLQVSALSLFDRRFL